VLSIAVRTKQLCSFSSMTAPKIPPSALKSGESDYVVSGKLLAGYCILGIILSSLTCEKSVYNKSSCFSQSVLSCWTSYICCLTACLCCCFTLKRAGIREKPRWFHYRAVVIYLFFACSISHLVWSLNKTEVWWFH
jgi:hypothetical protein